MSLQSSHISKIHLADTEHKKTVSIEDHPLVSVIIPNYNHARFLDERMRSVLGQTYQNIEVIILDDCSTDNSREVIEKYRNHPKVAKIVYNDKNTGKPFQQWNKGISLASGGIIWIAESDDSCAPQLLERLVKLYVEHNCTFCFCRSLFTYEDGSAFGSGHETLPSDEVVQCWKGAEFIKNKLSAANVVMNASCVIFSKETALTVDHNFEKMRGSGDWLFWIEMAEKGYVGFDSRAMNHFRQHDNNTTQKLYRNGTDMIEDHSIWLYLREHGLVSRKKAWELQKYRIMWQMGYEFESEEIRRKVLRTWGYGHPLTWLRVFLARAFSSLAYRI